MSFHLSDVWLGLGSFLFEQVVVLAAVMAATIWKPRGWPAWVALVLAALSWTVAGLEASMSLIRAALADAAFAAVLTAATVARWPGIGTIGAVCGVAVACLSAISSAPAHAVFSSSGGRGDGDETAGLPVTIIAHANVRMTVAIALLAPGAMLLIRRRGRFAARR
jgi:hypothetical protein